MNNRSHDLCPCQKPDGKSYFSCCMPYHQGIKKPETAEQLMRSRYSAYALGQVDYLLHTSLPDQQKLIDQVALKDWLEKNQWLGLDIIELSKGQARDSTGIVSFIARYKFRNKIKEHKETSHFQKENGNWYFVYNLKDLDLNKARIGRNDPCPCGSGKKFKKCCST